MNLTFATAEVSRAQRLPSLRAVVSQQFLDLCLVPLAHDAGRDLDAFISIRELGGVRIARFGGSPVAAARTAVHIGLSDGSYYMLACTCVALPAPASSGARSPCAPVISRCSTARTRTRSSSRTPLCSNMSHIGSRRLASRRAPTRSSAR